MKEEKKNIKFNIHTVLIYLHKNEGEVLSLLLSNIHSMLHVEVSDLHNNEDINYAKESTRSLLIHESKYDRKISD